MFRELVDRLELLEDVAWQRTLAQFQPDENGMVRFPYREPVAAKLWTADEAKEKD